MGTSRLGGKWCGKDGHPMQFLWSLVFEGVKKSPNFLFFGSWHNLSISLFVTHLTPAIAAAATAAFFIPMFLLNLDESSVILK
jgi:hypothetical protein